MIDAKLKEKKAKRYTKICEKLEYLNEEAIELEQEFK